MNATPLFRRVGGGGLEPRDWGLAIRDWKRRSETAGLEQVGQYPAVQFRQEPLFRPVGGAGREGFQDGQPMSKSPKPSGRANCSVFAPFQRRFNRRPPVVPSPCVYCTYGYTRETHPDPGALCEEFPQPREGQCIGIQYLKESPRREGCVDQHGPARARVTKPRARTGSLQSLHSRHGFR
jgi:hypothetical protein